MNEVNETRSGSTDASRCSAAVGPQLTGDAQRSAAARAKNLELCRALENGETVTIHGSQWGEFVRLSELVYPGSRVWHCTFSSGKVEIRDTTNQPAVSDDR